MTIGTSHLFCVLRSALFLPPKENRKARPNFPPPWLWMKSCRCPDVCDRSPAYLGAKQGVLPPAQGLTAGFWVSRARRERLDRTAGPASVRTRRDLDAHTASQDTSPELLPVRFPKCRKARVPACRTAHPTARRTACLTAPEAARLPTRRAACLSARGRRVHKSVNKPDFCHKDCTPMRRAKCLPSGTINFDFVLVAV